MSGPPTLFRERTLLAWSRTTVASLVVAGLLVRLAERGRAPVAGELAAVLALALAGATWWASRRRRARDRYERVALFALSAGTVAVAGAALVAVALSLA
ncbi:MAG TPA: DUF202 domain-containing protein [Thermoleophilaceae bacterium]|nr:DUF202 domain-containing protein [Thermoleophilaceae bacterium]